MPIGIVEGLTAGKAALEVSKLLNDLLNRPDVNVGDVRIKVNELLIHLVNAQVSLGEAHIEINNLRGEVETLKRVANFGEQFSFDEGVYWHRDYPYCPNCWDVDRKPIRLDGPSGMDNTSWQCPIHHSYYFLNRYKRDHAF